MHAAVGWALGGVAGLLAELFTGTFVLLFVGGAALAAAAVAWVTGGGPLPWVAFIVLAPCGLWLMRPWAMRRMGRAGARTNVDALIGETAYAVAAFDPATRIGRVRVSGLEWRAELCEGAPATPAPRYWVQEVHGATLVVVPLDTLSAPH